MGILKAYKWLNNMLQTTGKGHCFICHSDYDNSRTGNHQCTGTPTPRNCSKCFNWDKKYNDFKYCPHCGKELRIWKACRLWREKTWQGCWIDYNGVNE